MQSPAAVPAPISANAWSCQKKIPMKLRLVQSVDVVWWMRGVLVHVLGRNLDVHMDSESETV